MKNTVAVVVAVWGLSSVSLAAPSKKAVPAPAVSAAAPAAAPQAAYGLKEGEAEVQFTAIGQPSALKIVGTTKAVRGSLKLLPSGVDGEFSLDLATMDTGIGMRNSHMKERYLETEKFPQAILKISKLGELKAGSGVAPGSLPFEGKLTLHGVTRDQTGTLEILEGGADTVPVRAKMELKLSDYEIKIPSFAGITFAEQVVVSVDGKVARAP